MPQSLRFQFKDHAFACSVSKVDRAALYGTTETIVEDETGRRCTLMSLAPDGKTLIPQGGTALAYLAPDGSWREKTQLKPVDVHGDPIEPVESTFKVDTTLTEKASYEDYLDCNVRLLYLLETVEGEFPSSLLEELAHGSIYTFAFSYRAGWEADRAFLLADLQGLPWLAVGKSTRIQWTSFESQTTTEVEAVEEEDQSLMDFSF